MEVGLHPLVILNIADHFTRVSVNLPHQKRAVGAVFGQLQDSDRTIHVTNSFELSFQVTLDEQKQADLQIDEDDFISRTELFKSVFPEQEFLGWYSAGFSVPEKGDLFAHQTLSKYNENPIYFIMDTSNANPDADDLPITAYTLEVRFVNNAAVSEFAKIPYKILSNESERISIDHISTNISSSGESTKSSTTLYLESLHKAISTLETRFSDLREFLVELQKDPSMLSEEKHYDMLKKIQVICSRIPTMNPGSFKGDFDEQSSDVLLTLCLSMITKAEAGVKDANSVFNFYRQETSQKKQRPGPAFQGFPSFSKERDRGFGRRLMH